MNYIKIPKAEVIRMSGPDGIDLLQRISTNDISLLHDGANGNTILTTEKGKIVDIVAVIRLSSDEVLLSSWSGQSATIRAWIEKFIIMENISVREETGYLHYRAFGEEKTKFKGGDWICFSTSFENVEFENFFVPPRAEAMLREALEKQGGKEVPFDDFEDFCIRAGVPRWPDEISTDINPLEAGLGNLISWTKGCYVGQEVIARLDTYKKVQKHLLSFELDERPMMLPAPIRADGSEVGSLTSVTRNAPYAGLGYVKSGHESIVLSVKSNERFITLRKRS